MTAKNAKRKPSVKTTSGNGGRFKKGQPRPKGAGRKPGSRNKITRSVKEAFEAAFKQLQENPKAELAAWALKSQTNLREFYKIAARFIPLEVSGPGGGDITVRDAETLYGRARRVAYAMAVGAMAMRDKQPKVALPAPKEPADPATVAERAEREINPRPSPAASDYAPPPYVPPFVPSADERGDG